MWIATADGFISVVQHDGREDWVRVRARKRDHLAPICALDRSTVIDLGPEAPDYRWHANVARETLIRYLVGYVAERLTYTSHAKEAMAGDDDDYYSSLMGTWSAMMKLQK